LNVTSSVVSIPRQSEQTGVPPPSAPRVWVDYNKWGVADGHGKVFLAAAEATEQADARRVLEGA